MPNDGTSAPSSAKKLESDVMAYIASRARKYGYGVRIATMHLTLTSKKLFKAKKVRTVTAHFVSDKVRRSHITAAITELSANTATVNEKANAFLDGKN